LGIKPHMIKIAVQNKHGTPLGLIPGKAEIMHHDLVAGGIDIALMVLDFRVLDPEIKPVKAAVSDHLITKFPGMGGIEWFKSFQQRMPVPVRYFYGICFPVHVELNACDE